MSGFPKITKKGGLQLTRRALGLIPPDDHAGNEHLIQDPVFVAIDFEKLSNVQIDDPGDFEVGLSIMDPMQTTPTHPDEVITTYNLACGSPSYFDRVSRRFLFGKTISVEPHKLAQHLESLIPCSRQIILVGHSIKGDLQCLERLQFYSHAIVAIVDTSWIGKEVYSLWLSLRGALERVEGPFNRQGFHNAGNDSHFTLQLLLLFATKSDFEPLDIQIRQHGKDSSCKYKRWKRWLRSNKRKSRLRDSAEEDLIRAERAAKKRYHNEIELYLHMADLFDT